MSFSVGIGIVTYNRAAVVARTIDLVREYTLQSHAAYVVADDGSTDGTPEMLRDMQVPVVGGANMGIAWNKNRALFLLARILRCDAVILLEDDTRPTRPGWEAEWIEAAHRWGHVNYAADWIDHNFISGDGTAADPINSRSLVAQCSSFSDACLSFGGYMDPRFKGYGHEHIEHTRRLIRLGYGGTDEVVGGVEQVVYKMIKGSLVVDGSHTFYNAEQEQRNQILAQRLMAEQGYRAPWSDDDELRRFRSEIEQAMAWGPEHFRLTVGPVVPARPGQGIFSPLFHVP